jgi:protein O-GlcNAcase / histone acetyltransferase
MPKGAEFLAGVIEGFYGQPWNQRQRFQLFDQMHTLGLNTYFYAPKDDLKHRALWRERYSDVEAEVLCESINACRERKLRFIYGLGPGLDIRYSSETDLEHLRVRIQEISALGCSDFALLFDDIPDQIDAADAERFGSFASAQCHVTNSLFRWSRDQGVSCRFLFCPTPYCGRMAERKLGGGHYLDTIGRQLAPEIDVFWTGPEIISREITVPHIRELATKLRRQPLIWDNLHANDYDGRRFFCGPYSGRPGELRAEVAGILINPNTEFALNHLPMRTFADYLKSTQSWDPRASYLKALGEWLPYFRTVHGEPPLEDLLLFGDCYYLPHEEGPEAANLFQQIENLLQQDKVSQRDAEPILKRLRSLKHFCASLAELQDRELFYALNRRAWELREELDLVINYIAFLSKKETGSSPFTSDYHLPGTYRGGFVARLQHLLVQEPDGSFKPQSLR